MITTLTAAAAPADAGLILIGAPIGYTLDGEMYSAPDVHISLGPRLRIIAADTKKSPPRIFPVDLLT